MLYVTGDTHGDYERFTSSALKKLKKGDTLFICGDFGFIWDGSKNEEKLLKKIGKLKYNVCFIDGTHENFERLRSYEVSEFKGGKVHHITGNLYHLMRGQVYDFDGVSVFAMGGGESPDIDIRSDLNSWAGDEIPTEAELTEGAHAARLAALYCCTPDETPAQAARYAAVLDGLETTFGAHTEAGLYSAPGRTEIGGNHTDHQHGRVLAGSVNIDMIAAAAPNSLNQLRVQREGYDLCVIDLAALTARKEEENTTASLLRGECEAFRQRGAKLSGLDVYISSNVPKGSGVSSSAAFEVLVGVILNDCFMDEKVSPIAIAQIGQWAENVYFGKPCGLMDQMASSVGNIITIDFADKANPDVEPVQVDFSKAGLALCILDSGADHADLTDEYAAIPNECRAVAAVCGGEVLRDVPFETFLANIPACRKQCGDRAVLRAFHFYADNDRVPQQVAALREGDFDAFLQMVTASGDSSWEYLQNVIPAGYKEHQEVAVTIAAAKHYLGGKGAVRVHGGGFAGTVQAFVPVEMLADFKANMEKILGAGRCHVLSIRPEGGAVL